jgi:glyoxylase-like metal-dependent hydrolase (beta-lactamase superfamily II)
MGRDRVIGAWVQRGVVIDPGPASTVGAVIDAARAAGDELEAILLTHIHLDHAAGTGTLVREFPSARVYVHELGAPHMIDPSRLWASASRLYGEKRMSELWGDVLPVPADRITTIQGGEMVAGMDVLATPGHAGHHVCYLDPGDGSAYVGDVAGVRIPPGTVTVMPTPPPEIDVEAWLASIAALRARRPARLRLTHFGEVDAPEEQLRAAEDALREMSALAEDGDRDRFLAAVEGRIDSQPADAAERMRAAMPPEQVWMGLERYWRKRHEAA